MPTERPLEPTERDELDTAAQDAVHRLATDATTPTAMIEALTEAVVSGQVRGPEQIFAAGALLAACLEVVLGWELVELDFDSSLTALAVVEMDRSLVILPLLTVERMLREPELRRSLQDSISRMLAGERPPGLTRRGYAVLLP